MRVHTSVLLNREGKVRLFSLSLSLTILAHTHRSTYIWTLETRNRNAARVEQLSWFSDWTLWEKLELNSSQLQHWPSIGLLIRTLILLFLPQFAATFTVYKDFTQRIQSTNTVSKREKKIQPLQVLAAWIFLHFQPLTLSLNNLNAYKVLPSQACSVQLTSTSYFTSLTNE